MRKLGGTNESLPALLKDLHPTYMVIGTNGVELMVGYGRMSYGIGWAPSASDHSLWELKASRGEGSRAQVLLIRRKHAVQEENR